MTATEDRDPAHQAGEDPTRPRGWSRRTFVAVATAATSAAATGTLDHPRAYAAAQVVLGGDGVRLEATAGILTVIGSTGAARVELGAPRLNPQGAPDSGQPKLVRRSDGTQAIRISYAWELPIGIRAEFWFGGPGHVHARYDITGATPSDDYSDDPAKVWLDGIQVERRWLPDGSPDESFDKPVEWVRDDRGGVPYERSLTEVYSVGWTDEAAALVVPGSNSAWTDDSVVSTPAVKVGARHCAIDLDLILTADRHPAAAATIAAGRTLGVRLSTDQRWNLWDAFDRPLAVHAEIVNGSTSARTVRLSWQARDFDGRLIASGQSTRSVPGRGVWTPVITVDPTTIQPAPQRIAFLQVTAGSGDAEAIARTTLTAIDTYDFAAGKQSRIGLGGFGPPEWSTEYDLELAGRVGVRWLRSPQLPAATVASAGMYATFQPTNDGVDLGKPPTSAWFDQFDSDLAEYGAENVELFNELNGDGGYLSGTDAEAYVQNWLRPVAEHLRNAATRPTLATQGAAGMDYVWVQKMADAGGWDCIDALAIHPGRGNFTADYAPPRDQWDTGSNGEYWNYYGALREARRLIRQYGERELWLTEVYALTHPNDWWNDTERQAAENTLLEQLLAVQIGVTRTMWYQLHNGVWWDPDGVDITDREYYFGLLQHDLSLKPMMLAFETAARLLDGGTRFVRWLDLDDPDLRGMLFSGPAGEFAAVWSRKDGFILNADHGNADDNWYPFDDPWVDDWPTKTSVELPAAADSVRELDCIGRERRLQVENRTVTARLDGAPRVLFGLDTAAIPTAPEPD